MKLLLALSLVVAACWAETYDEHHDRMVDEINARASTWQAGYNEYFRGQDMKTLKHMLGVRRGYRWGPSHYPRVDEAATPLPENFDARTQWSECASIAHIRDQSRCGSCWAVSTAEMASDRICIGSQGKVQPYISAEDLMTCCYFCGYGCRGGYPIKAAQYWQQDGIVTGGDYGSKHGCQPYEIHGSGPEVNTPSCKKSCVSGYSKSYNSDKHYAKSHYYVRGGPSAIQTEVMTKGSVVAAFDVYEDFYHYKSGVYQHTSGGYLGGHAVRIIGWGVENSTPYWLVANSWSDTWGENGLFKILRGKNECGFEAQCVAGTGSN